jgi:hypothetical protein
MANSRPEDHNMHMTVRPATVEDLEVIVRLTKRRRDQQAQWQPRYLIESFNDKPGLVCAPTNDLEMTEWFRSTGRAQLSAYRNVWLNTLVAESGPFDTTIPIDIGEAPRHSFENAIDPTNPNALIVVTEQGFAFGTPPLLPPTYDPGRPTSVIDRIVGNNRKRTLHMALQACKAKGDAQSIVVCGPTDTELSKLLDEVGAEHPVNVWSTAR